MNIEFIRFKYEQGLSGGEKLLIAGDSDLEELRVTGRPQALIAGENNIERLKSYRGLILNRGKKDHRKGLAAVLVGKRLDFIPMIYADYKGSGKLKDSIKKLLANATAKEDHRSFIIVVSHENFYSLNREIEDSGFPDTAKLLDKSEERPHGAGKIEANFAADISSAGSFQSIQDDLFDFEVPDELKRTYLGDSGEYEMVRKMIVRAAELEEVPVLILGPSGSGKEKVAALIHERSRWRGRFVAVNCGAIPRELFEAELFGQKRGSHSTAYTDKTGLWEEANGGTLFLDEVGDLLPEHQVKILRALDEHEIRPVGGNTAKEVDARIIAATNRELFPMVQEGRFREDLYYRLRKFLIRTPTLTPIEIPRLADTFWKKITKSGLPLSDSFKNRLTHYAWPGNIRHLKGVLIQVHALFPGKLVDARHLDWIMTMDGHNPPTVLQMSARENAKPNMAACLQHLHKTEEVVRAAWQLITPGLAGNASGSQEIFELKNKTQARLKEMEEFSKNSRYFGREETFRSVHNFKGKLKSFHDLLKHDFPGAKIYWNREIKDELENVLGSVRKEIEAIQEEAHLIESRPAAGRLETPGIENAVELAAKAHRGQVDKAGAPYILHPLRVMLKMQTEKEKIVAVLHDALEDTTVDAPLLKKLGYCDEIIDAVKCLTRSSTEPYFDYIERIKTNPLSTAVKLADLEDNMDRNRIKNPSPKDLKRYQKYEKALRILKQADAKNFSE